MTEYDDEMKKLDEEQKEAFRSIRIFASKLDIKSLSILGLIVSEQIFRKSSEVKE